MFGAAWSLLLATRILYPLEGAVFPPDIAPPTVKWEGRERVVRVAGIEATATTNQWTPTAAQWAAIQRESPAVLRVGDAHVTFSTAREPVGAPLFYREVVLPFAEAVKDPGKLRWRFGPVSSLEPPRAVLQDLPVCGNCHSFSRDGKTLGMDVDYANDKGSYGIVPVGPEMALRREQLITWTDYRRQDGERTFGLLSQVSPDGRRVVSTVKDRSIFMAKADLAFSQLFFPIKGILAIYDRQSGKFAAVAGADDKAFVQSNPSWSPDGNYIYFARAPAEDLPNLKHPESALVTEAEAAAFFARRPRYQFDICRIPATGGKAEPVKGAAGNDASNFFPRVSPDGQWLVFASKANGPYTQLWLTHVDEAGNDAAPVVLDRLTAPERAANIPEFVNAAPEAIATIAERFMDDLNYVRAGTDLFNAGEVARADQAVWQRYQTEEAGKPFALP